MSRTKQIIALVLSLGIAFSVAWMGAFFTDLSIGTWYPTLIKPAWTPSGAAIGLIWTILYGLMAIAAWVVWLDCGAKRQRHPLGLYALQLLLNLGWTFVFFGLRSPGIALVEIGVLWMAIFVTSVSFWRTSRVAGALMVPYLIWVSFAAALNAEIWRLN